MSWAAALGSIGGDLLQNQWERSAAAKQRRTAVEMSNTAHQREVADLIAAGLNPILSAGGTGASTPSIGKAGVPTPGQGLNSAYANMIQKKQMEANVKNVKAQAQSNEMTAKLDTAAYKYYEDNPEIQGAVKAAILGKKAGISPHIAATLGLYNSAGSVKYKELGKSLRKLPEMDKEVQIPMIDEIFKKLDGVRD